MIREQQTEKVVVKEWETTRTLVCDGCSLELLLTMTSNPTGWYVLKAWELPPWYDLECHHHSVRHYCSVACIERGLVDL